MRGTHAHRMDQVFMGGPNKSGHDGEFWGSAFITGPFVLFVFFVVLLIGTHPSRERRSWARRRR